jgi:hypothetical protein
MAMQKVVMDFLLEKDIATLTVLYANIQFEGIDWYKTTMQKQLWEALEAPKFEEDHNCKDYARWEDLKLRDVIFNLVEWVSIIYSLKEDFSPEILLLHEKVKWWMGWSNFFAKNKTRLPSWVEKGQKANLSQAHLDERSFGCHHLPPLCLF